MSAHDPKDPELIRKMAADADLKATARKLFDRSCEFRYSYNFKWLGRPIIQYPQDMVALQEIIWDVQPQVIVETGIAHGGSLIFHASILELIGGDGIVVGVDIDIRAHNRTELEQHRLARRLRLIEGSSTSEAIAEEVKKHVAGRAPVMVILDSMHTEAHVLRELELYAPLVTKGSYLVVLDTVIEDMPADAFPDRPWGKGNNPMTAVHQFLKTNPRFRIEPELHQKLLLTVAPDGYLRCLAD